jgi:acyl carrier protein
VKDLGTVLEIEALLVRRLAEALRIEPSSMDVDAPLASYGIDSLTAITLTGELEEWLGRQVSPTLVWDHPTIRAIAVHLSSSAADQPFREGDDGEEVPRRFYEFELSAEYGALKDRMRQLGSLGLDNPYFHARDGRAGAMIDFSGRALVNFDTYNYLGLSGHPAVVHGARDAIERYGTSVSASRLVSGEITLHRELEHELAALITAEDCIAFVSGHATNVGTIGHLFGPRDLVLSDSLIHNSVLVGARLAGASVRSFAHNDPEEADAVLGRVAAAFESTMGFRPPRSTSGWAR